MLEVPPLRFGLILSVPSNFVISLYSPFLILGNPMKGLEPFETRTCEVMGFAHVRKHNSNIQGNSNETHIRRKEARFQA